MKTNNKTKIIVPVLGTLMGAALVGSISGSVAWYQYSTRAQAEWLGTSIKCGEGLEIKNTSTGASSAWGSRLKTSGDNLDLVDQFEANCAGTAFQPVTPGDHNTDLSAFYGHPKYQDFAYSAWQAAPANSYVKFKLSFHVKDIDGESSASYLARDLYLTDLTIAADAANTTGTSLAGAIRVGILNNTTLTVLGNAAGTDTLGAKLDLNNDGQFDKAKGYSWENPEETKYGDDTKSTSVTRDKIVADAGNAGALDGASNFIAQIPASEAGVELTFVIWLEGWADTGATAASSIWSTPKAYLGDFHVGMRFATGVHSA